RVRGGGVGLLKLVVIAAVAIALASSVLAQQPRRAVRLDLPLTPAIRKAYARGTRDSSGAPGLRYWQQRVDYRIDATIDAPAAMLRGTEHVTLHNTSPDTLKQVVLRLYQNYFKAETERNDYVTDIT